MMLLRRLQALREVVTAAMSVESSYTAGLAHEYDPDDLHDLRMAVTRLRGLL